MSSAKISSRPKLVTIPSTFSPTSITGCVLWIDAADSTKITMSGSNVTQIVDKSSNAYTFTGSAGTYPTRTTTLNGLPVISSSTGRNLQTTNFNQNFTTATFFAVVRPTEDITPNGKSGNGYAAYGIVAGTQLGDFAFVVTYANQSQSGDPSKFFIEIDKQGTGFINGALGGASPSTYNPVNTPLNIGAVMTGSSGTNTAYLNGTSVNLTYNVSGTFPLQSSRTVSVFWGFGCDYAETLVYGSVLTTTQRQEVEGYLAQKWGLTASLPAGHPGLTSILYPTISIAPTTTVISVSFVPTSITGCGIWLDATDLTTFTYSSGSNISQWRDKSGSSNHFGLSRGTATSTVDNGRNVVNFVDGTVMTSANQISFTTSSAFFIVSKMTSTNSAQNLIGFYPGINNGFSLRFFSSVLYSGNGDDLSLGNYYVNGNFNPTYTSNAYYNTYSLISTTTPSRGATTIISLSDNWILEGFAQRFFIGNIAEFLYYPAGMTSTQRQTVEGYLAQKWGLTSNLPGGHTGLTSTLFGTTIIVLPKQKVANIPRTITTVSSYLPTAISGCQLWLDGADSTSIVLSGSNVTAWNDKSGNGYHMNTLTGNASWTGTAVYPTMGTSINGRSTVNFTAQAGLKQSTTLGNVKNLFWVGRIAAPIGSGSDLYFLLGHDSSYEWAAGSYGGKFINTGFAPSGIYNASPTSLFTSDVNATSNATFQNVNMPSAPNVSLLSVAGITGNTPYQGICYDRTAHIGWCGDLAEVLIYNSPLTTTERQTVESYLANKWGLTSNLSVGHPGLTSIPNRTTTTIVPITTTVTFSPTSIAGCQLWLDALDSSTVTGTTTVTQWRDKSGNARHLGAGSGTTSYSSNAIQVNNSYLYVESPVNLSSFTVFIVTKTTGGNNQTVFSGKPNPANTDEDWDSLDGFGFFMDSQSSVRFYGQFSNVSQFNVNTSTPQMFSFQSSGTSLSSWYNGVSKTGATLSSSRTSTAQGFMVGASWSGSSYYNIVATASVYEAITYNTILTTTQRQQVESYLAQKWSLTSNLSSGHPGLTTSVYQNTVTLPKQKIRAIQPVVIAPLTYYNVSPDNWTSYWLPYLQGLTSVNSTATPTFSTLTGSLSSYNSGYLAVNGNIYLAPASSTYSTPITIIPTVNDGSISSSLVSGTGGATNYGGDFLGGGGLAPNGIIYFGPYDATYIATVNPTTNVFTLNPYSQAPPQLNSLGGVLAADGNFYFVPYYNFTSIYYFNPTTNTYSSFAITKSNTRYYGGILAPNGKIYGLAFYNISTIMCVIDPVAKTFAEVGTASTQQYRFMVYGGNGTIYAFPSGASNIGVLNTTNDTITPNVISGGTGYTSGVLGPDGKIYLFGSGTIGILNVATGNITTLPSVSGSYQRGVLTATGNIYLLPSSGTSTVGLIKFSGLSQTPLLSFCLSPYVNRQVTLY